MFNRKIKTDLKEYYNNKDNKIDIVDSARQIGKKFYY